MLPSQAFIETINKFGISVSELAMNARLGSITARQCQILLFGFGVPWQA
jgi:hypothetical protein